MEYYILSKSGTREINEDSAAVVKSECGFCCVLADGLGGHDRGEVASKTVTENCLQIFGRMTVNFLDDFFNLSFQEAQRKLKEKQKEQKSQMKTTMVLLACNNDKIQWGHIGDSRLYYFQNGKIKMRTFDHSVPQMLVKIGEIREEEIRGHEDRNQLLRVLGGEESVFKYEIGKAISPEKSQAFLLCSDGFWEWIEERTMIRLLKRADSPKEWLLQMEKEILKNGQGREMDNYSAIGVFVESRIKTTGFWGRIKSV